MEGQSTNNNTNTAPTTVVGVDSGIPTVEGLTQQLDALKASTSEWKKAVKVQLLDAQTKNQQIRLERDQLRTAAEESSAKVRLQLDSEYKERFQLKDGEIARLQSQLTSLRQQATQASADHQADLARIEEEKVTSIELAKKELQSEVAKIQRQLMESNAAQTAQQGEIARLKGELASQADAPLSSTSAELESLRGVNRRLQQDLTELRSQQAETEADLRDELEAHFQNEIELRDSQINILQSTLQQSRKDVTFYTQKTRSLQQAQESVTEHLEAKAGALRSDLVAAHTTLEALKQENELISSELTKTVRRCRDLEADRDARDILERDINASMSNKEVVDGGGTSNGSTLPELKEEIRHLNSEVERMKSEVAARDSKVNAREKSLLDQEARIAVEMDKLKRQEQKSAEQLSQLVQQANANLETLKKRQPSKKSQSPATATFSLDNDGAVVTDDPTFAAQENVRHWASVIRSHIPASVVAVSGHRRNRTIAIAVAMFFIILLTFSSSSSSASPKSDMKMSDAITKLGLYEQERSVLQKTIADLAEKCSGPANNKHKPPVKV